MLSGHTRPARGDDGQILVFALVFLVLFGLLIAALLSQVDAHFAMTGIVRDQNAKVYAADGGIDFRIRTLRDDGTICAQPSATQTQFLTTTIGALATGPTRESSGAVNVTCQTLSGTGLVARGYALVTLDPGSSSLCAQSGQGQQKIITGTV